jgi:glutaredoxin
MQSRQVVRVVEPADAEPRRDGRVHVADLTDADARGGYVTVLMSAYAFRVRALAALPPGEASRVVLPQAEGPPAAVAAATLRPHDQVVLYGTSWCNACKQLRDYLNRRHITFIERNVEIDRAAADELATKAAFAGVITDRVPIVDVRGVLLVGYDPVRLDELLGAPA